MRCRTRPSIRSPRAWPSNAARALVCGEGGHGRPFLRRPAAVSRCGRGTPTKHAGRQRSFSQRVRPLPLSSTSPHGRESRSSWLPQLSISTTPQRRLASVSALVHSGRKQAGIQYLMRRWRAIPAELHTRFLHDEFLTLPVDTQASITDLLLVQSREAGIAERTAALRHQRRTDREQTVRLDTVAAGITAAYRTRWHRLGGLAALLVLLASTF